MASSSSSLAKITPPRLPKVIERTRLYREIDRARKHASIIWITAPPGMGKTTLVASYLKARKLSCQWYQIDEGDADPATLFHYLGLASKKAAPRYRYPLPHLTPEYLPGLPIFTRRFFEKMYVRMKSPSFIVFDNYQQLPRESPVQDLIEIGLGLLSQDSTAIIMSREQPPPAMARLQADQALVVIDAESLKLTPSETRRIVQLHKPTKIAKRSGFNVSKSQEIVRGWVGGLVLLLKDVNLEVSVSLDESERIPELLFDYLARETLKRLPDDTQTLLLTSSLFPFFTSEMARTLSGVATAKEHLNRLYQSRYFIEGRSGTDQTYQYHPLFQSFLRVKLEEQCSGKELTNLRRQAGLILKACGWMEEAVELLQAAGELDTLITIILEQAPAMLAQGRGKKLEQWIQQLPGDVIDQTPWVGFWLGNCLLGVASQEAARIFRAAFQQFQEKSETAGALFAWCGYVEATLFHWEDLSVLDQWLERFPVKDLTRLNELDPSLQARVSASMLSLYYWRRQHDPDIHWWYEQVVERLDFFDNPFQMVFSAFTLLVFNCQLGRMEKAWEVTHRLEAVTENSKIPEFVRCHITSIKCLCAYHSGELDDCRELLRENKSISEREGFFAGIHDDAQELYINLVLDDIETAKECAERLRPLMEHGKGFVGGHYHFMMTWLSINAGNLEKARQHGERALQEVTRLKTPYAIGDCELAMAHVEHELGQREQPWIRVRRADECGKSIRSPLLIFRCLLTEAYFLLKDQRRKDAIKPLRDAMKVGRVTNQTVTSFWRPKVMALLCAEALKHNIEVSYVQNLIRLRHLVPEESPLGIPNWPWPVKVTMLGGFAIEVSDHPITFGRKVPRRVLALLQALIAFGRENVREDKLLDALWSESDGDRAYRSYATALHRLRKILGDEKAILVKDSKVTLNSQWCWVDAWAFEHLLGQATRAEQAGENERSLDLRGQALQLYQGPFLGEDDGKPWAARIRARLQKRYEAQLSLVT